MIIFPFYYLTLFGNKAGFVNYYCQIKHRSRIRGVIEGVFYNFLRALKSKGSSQDHSSSLECNVRLNN